MELSSMDLLYPEGHASVSSHGHSSAKYRMLRHLGLTSILDHGPEGTQFKANLDTSVAFLELVRITARDEGVSNTERNRTVDTTQTVLVHDNGG